jgi:hypothetical protein
MSRMALDTLSFLSAFHRTMLGTGYGGCFQGVISELEGPVWPSSSEDIYSAQEVASIKSFKLDPRVLHPVDGENGLQIRVATPKKKPGRKPSGLSGTIRALGK